MTDGPADHQTSSSPSSPAPTSSPPTSSSSSSGPGRRGGGRDRELLESISEGLKLMRPELERLRGLVEQHGGLLSEAMPRLGAVEHGLATVLGRLTALEGVEEPDDREGPYAEAALLAAGLAPDPGHQVDWQLMSAEQAAGAWQALGAWVATVVCGRLRFTRAQLPDCWALHPPAVAALSWAHQLHRVLAGKGVGAVAMAEFDTRWLPHLHARLAAAIPLDVLDPRDPSQSSRRSQTDAAGERASLGPRCRLGHYHQLAPHQRVLAEAGLDPRAAEAAAKADIGSVYPRESGDFTWLTGPGLGSPPSTELTGGAAARRVLAENRNRAQHALDQMFPAQGARDGLPDRPRYLEVHPADDHPHKHPAAGQRSHPALWLPLLREAGHHDIAVRRAFGHHQALDLGLGYRDGDDPGAGGAAGPAPE